MVTQKYYKKYIIRIHDVCYRDSVYLKIEIHRNLLRFFLAINCTDPPVDVDATGLALRNWTEVEGNPRPYATEILYTCTREGWGYPSSGLNRNLFSIHTCNKTMKKYFVIFGNDLIALYFLILKSR